MSWPQIDPGVAVFPTFTFTALEGPLTTVTAVCTVENPHGVEDALPVVVAAISGLVATFAYEFDIPDTNDSTGYWAFRCKTSGQIEDTHELVLRCRSSVVLS